MPLYEYECDACGHRFEKIQKFSDPPIEKCPACGGTVHKLQSAPAFQFKGTGWYVTDYAKTGSGAKDKDKDGKKSDSGAKTDSAASTDKPASSESSSSSTPAPSSPAPAAKTDTK
jgi:putative FmdB family regulatory protein